MRYRCMETFGFPNCYYEIGESKDEYITVRAGTIWETGDANYIGGEVHLDSDDGLSWIEITRDDLEEHFLNIWQVSGDGLA